MKKKYFILAFTFLCLLMGQNSFGQYNGTGDYTNDDCDHDSVNYDPTATDCDKDYCDSSSPDFDPELCSMGGDSCDSTSEDYDPVKCANSGDVCDPLSEAYDPVECANNPGGDPCDPFSSNFDPWLCSSGGGDPCDPSSNAYDPIVCAINSEDPCDPFSSNFDPNAPECNSNPDTGDVCDETSSSYDYIACNYPGGTGGGSNGGSSGGSSGTTTTSNVYTWYIDGDGDGYGVLTTQSATRPTGIGWYQGASMGMDCDDSNSDIKECNLPTPEAVTNTTICRCINPPNKSNFNNVTNITNVLDSKQWIIFNGNCNASAKEQIAQALLPNTTPRGAGSEINLFIDKVRQTQSGKLTTEVDMQKAIDVIAKNLKEGKPVLAGVMYERYFGADKALGGTLDDNNNVATNHFVTIVGMGIDNGKPYFSYYDNFVDSQFKDGSARSLSTMEFIGTNTNENRLYYYKDSVGNYYFSDKTAKTLDGPTTDPNHHGHGYGNQYILTEIRDNF